MNGRHRAAAPGAVALALAVATATFWVAYDGGGYAPTSRTELAIGVLWLLALGVALGLLPVARVPRAALLTGALLAGLALWTVASTGWAASAEGAFEEFNRVVLYLGVFALAALGGTRRAAARWADGLALGIVGVAVLALAARLFPGLVAKDALETLLPTTHVRLSYPVNYWNGLAMLLGLGFPLLLRWAVAAGSPARRALGVAPLPLLGAGIYLASSRGGAVVAFAGAIAFVAASSRRWLAAGAAAAGVLGTLFAVVALHAREGVVDPPPGVQGPTAPEIALLLLLACALVGALYALVARLNLRPPPAVGYAAAAALGAATVFLVVLAHPRQRFEAFKQPPDPPAKGVRDYVQSHLLSSNGSGRWQFWGTAVDSFRSEPLHGRGAGSYEPWWLQHGTIAVFVRDAHSLYFESLAELGLVGLALLLGVLGAGLLAWLARLRGREDEERVTVAALGAAFLAYVVGAGIDWIWELPAVSLVGFVCLGLLTGAATSREDARPAFARGRRRVLVAAPVVAACLALLLAQAIGLLGDTRLADSQAHARRGDTAAAIASAEAARDVEPWAASPYLQLALVHERTGALRRAEAQTREALERNRLDWRTWLVRARIQVKQGRIPAARRSLRRARELNPRSPILQQRDRR